MNLSKAIFTLLRKLSLILFLFLALPVGAASYRTAVFSDDTGCMNLILDVLSVLSGDVTSESAIASYREKSERKVERERAQKVDGYIRAEDFTSLEEMEEEEVEVEEEVDDTLILEVVSASITDVERSFLEQGDAEAYSYIMLANDLDLLIVADTFEEGSLTDLSLWVNGDDIYNSLYLTSTEDDEFMNILKALMPYLKSEDTVIVSVSVPNIVSISIDGEPVSLLRSVLALEKGEHEIVYTSPRFETVRETVYADVGTVLSPRFIPLFSGPAFISSLPFDSTIYYQGERIEGHIVEEGTVPFSIAAQREGFAPYSLQSTVIDDTISIVLKPEWMGDTDLVSRAKRRFYDSLVMTIISFGAFVASDSLANIYTDVDLAPVAVVFTGVSFVQLVELFDAMFDYFQIARLGF